MLINKGFLATDDTIFVMIWSLDELIKTGL